jgi:hypothetical protein
MAKQTRSEKLNRLVKVQRHLEHMAEADLANTTRQREEVQASLNATVEAIGSMEPIHQIFAGLYSGQISRLTAKDQHLHNVQQIHENKMLVERTKGDRLAEHMKEARDHEDREADDAAIYDVIDQQIAAKYKPDNL